MSTESPKHEFIAVIGDKLIPTSRAVMETYARVFKDERVKFIPVTPQAANNENS